MDYFSCKILLVVFAVIHFASAQNVTVSGTCATIGQSLILNCTIENTSGAIFWYHNQDILSADCSDLDNRIDMARCDINPTSTSYVDIKVLSFTNDDEGNWTCINGQATATEQYGEEFNNICDSETYPQPSQYLFCYVYYGRCQESFNLNPVCAFPEPQVKLYRDGEDITNEAAIDKNPEFTCSDPLHYRISASYTVKSTKESVRFVYEVSYVEYQDIVFHTAEFVLNLKFCAWCICLSITCGLGITIAIILIYCCCKKKSKEKTDDEEAKVHEIEGKENPTYVEDKKSIDGKRKLPPNKKWLLSLISTGYKSEALAKITSNGEFKKLLMSKKTIQSRKRIKILKNEALVSIEENTDMDIVCFDGSKIEWKEKDAAKVDAVALVAADDFDKILAIVYEKRLLAIYEPTQYNVLISLSNDEDNLVDLQKIPHWYEEYLTVYYIKHTKETNM